MWTVIGKFFSGIKAYLYAAVAILLCGLAAYAEIEHKGKVAAQDKLATHDAEQKAATAVATVERIQTHDRIKEQVEKMPAPPTGVTRVGDAPAGTAAAELRDSFSRD